MRGLRASYSIRIEAQLKHTERLPELLLGHRDRMEMPVVLIGKLIFSGVQESAHSVICIDSARGLIA